MPQSKPSITRSLHLTIAFLSIFILAFFPGLLQFLVKLPLYPFKFLIIPFGSTSTPSLASSPICPAGCLPFPSGLAMSSPSWFQKTLTLPARSRGSYLITDSIVSQLPEIKDYKVGLLNLFVQHTSCALSMNENWDSEVREDMSDALDRIAPEDKNGNLYRHSAEGPDDMPAHIKSALIGASVTVPISNGKLATGTWQGIWYLEFRTSKHSRKVVATIQGEKSS